MAKIELIKSKGRKRKKKNCKLSKSAYSNTILNDPLSQSYNLAMVNVSS